MSRGSFGLEMVGRMNVQKRTKRKDLRLDNSALKLARKLHPGLLEQSPEESVNKLRSGSSQGYLLTLHQQRSIASNPNANISLTKKATKKLKRKIRTIELMHGDRAMEIDL